jgi:hypothetical protein
VSLLMTEEYKGPVPASCGGHGCPRTGTAAARTA